VSALLCVQTGPGSHPVSYTMGTGGSFPRGKARPERDADHSRPSSAEVKKGRSYTSSRSNAPLWSVTEPLYLHQDSYINAEGTKDSWKPKKLSKAGELSLPVLQKSSSTCKSPVSPKGATCSVSSTGYTRRCYCHVHSRSAGRFGRTVPFQPRTPDTHCAV
jgi:hypothetical protein